MAPNDEIGDLEPLEPADPFDAPAPSPERRREAREGSRVGAPRARRWPWLVLGIVGVWIAGAAWVSFAAGRDHDRRAGSTTTSVAGAGPTTSTVPSFGPQPLGEGHGRFAVVVDGHIWIVDTRSREVSGVRGLGRAQIVAVSGPSLLVRSDEPQDAGTRYVVDTRTGTAVRASDGTWIPRRGGGWWVADAGVLASGRDRYTAAPGVIALAHANAGFVAAPAAGGRIVLWDPRSGSTRALAPVPYTHLLGSDATRVVLGDPHCPGDASPHCAIEIVDIATGHTIAVSVPFRDQFVRSAVFASDGRRIAIWGTTGVSLIDAATGSVVKTLTAARLASVPLTFTADAGALLVLENPDPYRQVVVLRAVDGRFVRSWVSAQRLEQVVALTS